MSFNTYGRVFRVTTWGESHGPALGATVDGWLARVAGSTMTGLQVWASTRRKPWPVESSHAPAQGSRTTVGISSPASSKRHHPRTPAPADDFPSIPISARQDLRRPLADNVSAPGQCRHIPTTAENTEDYRRLSQDGTRPESSGQRQRPPSRVDTPERRVARAGTGRPPAQASPNHRQLLWSEMAARTKMRTRPVSTGTRDRRQPFLVHLDATPRRIGGLSSTV